MTTRARSEARRNRRMGTNIDVAGALARLFFSANDVCFYPIRGNGRSGAAVRHGCRGGRTVLDRAHLFPITNGKHALALGGYSPSWSVAAAGAANQRARRLEPKCSF